MRPLIFRGTFEYALDAKHRLTIPARYRGALADGVVLAFSPETEPGTPRSLSIWPTDAYGEYAEAALAGVNPLSPRARETQRMLNANSFDLEPDAANRLMIPAQALRYADLDKEVVITGSGPCLEVWDRAAYETYSEAALARFPEIAASFDHAD
ncbi:MAG: division/cell wall cluster transcriptional repressor MraZ [Solirubrobacteraceae bacterium]